MGKLAVFKAFHWKTYLGAVCLIVLLQGFETATAQVSLDGQWVSADNTTVVFAQNQYSLYENGSQTDRGTYFINGNVLTTQSAVTGGANQYAYQYQNNILLLQDSYGQVYQFKRSSSAGGFQAPQQQMPTSPGLQGNTNQNTQNQIVRFLAGTWKDIRSSGHTIIEIRADGTFSYYSDSAASGQFSNQYGPTGSWGYGNQGGTQGRWQARGTPQRGTIYYQTQSGEQGTMDFQVMTENGQIFWNECYFDGTLYQRQR